MRFLLIGLGGALGAMLRYAITLLCQHTQVPNTFGTLFINVAGSFLMGLLVSAFQQSPLLMMLTIGLCGGFTTFSTFSLQSVKLLQQGHYALAALYIFGTLALCVAFTLLGCFLGQRHAAALL